MIIRLLHRFIRERLNKKKKKLIKKYSFSGWVYKNSIFVSADFLEHLE